MNMRCNFIMCFNRDRSVESALEHLDQALAFRELIVGVGTDNPEHTAFPNPTISTHRTLRNSTRDTSSDVLEEPKRC
jgi:adenosine deaminase